MEYAALAGLISSLVGMLYGATGESDGKRVGAGVVLSTLPLWATLVFVAIVGAMFGSGAASGAVGLFVTVAVPLIAFSVTGYGVSLLTFSLLTSSSKSLRVILSSVLGSAAAATAGYLCAMIVAA